MNRVRNDKECTLIHAIDRHRAVLLTLGALALLPASAGADARGNLVRAIDARAVGGRTVITVHGTITPSFTAYRLERPARLVVDLADGQLDGRDVPMDVDSWAVSQISATQRSDATTRLVRLMIGFKRPSSYDVQASGNDVVVTVTPDEAPPAEMARDDKARAEEAKKARLSEEARRKDAVDARTKAEAELQRLEAQRAEVAKHAAEARAEAERRQAELEAMRGRVGNEAARAEEAHSRAVADRSEVARLEVERQKAVSEKEQAAKQAEAARAALAKAEAERAEAAKQVAQARAELARVEEARKSEQAALERTREQREAEGKATEMAAGRLARARAAEDEARRVALQRSNELERIEKQAAGRERIVQRKTAAELGRLETARLEAERLAATRETELRRLEAARVEAKRIAEERADEATRLDKVRAELAQLESARAAAAKVAEEQKRELERLSREKKAASGNSPLEAERVETERRLTAAKAELARFEHALDEARRAQAETASRPHHLAASPAPLAKASSEGAPALAARASTGSGSITDVDFQDGADVVKVVISVSGDPDYTVLRSGSTTTLRLKGVALPRRLARTLDTAAFRGPVSSVSTYADPRDPGAVRVDVKLGQDVEPDVHREVGSIVWEFPKANASQATTRSYPPARVAGYGPNTLPLQIGLPPPAASQPPPTGGARSVGTTIAPSKHFTGAHIDLDFKDADIHNILRLLADVGQVNIVTADDVKGSITIRMRDVPWDQALDVVLRAKGLGMVRDRNLIRVAPQSVLEKELEQQIARQQKEVDLRPISTRILPLSFAEASSILPRVQDLLSSRGKVSFDARTNVLIISDIAGNLKLAEDLVRSLDTQTPQVLIEARIVEANTSWSRAVGIQWGGGGIASPSTGNPTGVTFPATVGVAGAAADGQTPFAGALAQQSWLSGSPNYVVNMPAPIGTGSGGGLGFTFGNIAGTFNLNLRLTAAEATGNLRILSAPKITTLDNVDAMIQQGTSIPIATTSALGTNTVFVDATLQLKVKPHVTNEGTVVLNIDIMRNEPDFSRTSAQGDPTILKRMAKTEMLVHDGDTAVIGGIYTRNSAVNYTKVPWLADIPILGWLFKQRSETDTRGEMLLFITPRILNRAATAGGRGI